MMRERAAASQGAEGSSRDFDQYDGGQGIRDAGPSMENAQQGAPGPYKAGPGPVPTIKRGKLRSTIVSSPRLLIATVVVCSLMYVRYVTLSPPEAVFYGKYTPANSGGNAQLAFASRGQNVYQDGAQVSLYPGNLPSTGLLSNGNAGTAMTSQQALADNIMADAMAGQLLFGQQFPFSGSFLDFGGDQAGSVNKPAATVQPSAAGAGSTWNSQASWTNQVAANAGHLANSGSNGDSFSGNAISTTTGYNDQASMSGLAATNIVPSASTLPASTLPTGATLVSSVAASNPGASVPQAHGQGGMNGNLAARVAMWQAQRAGQRGGLQPNLIRPGAGAGGAGMSRAGWARDTTRIARPAGLEFMQSSAALPGQGGATVTSLNPQGGGTGGLMRGPGGTAVAGSAGQGLGGSSSAGLAGGSQSRAAAHAALLAAKEMVAARARGQGPGLVGQGAVSAVPASKDSEDGDDNDSDEESDDEGDEGGSDGDGPSRVLPGVGVPAGNGTGGNATRSDGMRKSRRVRSAAMAACRPYSGSLNTPALEGFPATFKDWGFKWEEMFLHQQSKNPVRKHFLQALPTTKEESMDLGVLPDGTRWDLARWPTARCAVVGNSGSLQATSYGAAIDAHDIVFRINQAPTKGYESMVGSKTSFRLLNQMWTNRYGRLPLLPSGRSKYPLEDGVTLVPSRLGKNIVNGALNLHNKLREVNASGLARGVRLRLLNRATVFMVHQLLYVYRKCHTKLTGRVFPGGNSPTSGIVAIYR
eukprot:jgi/Mesvir1/12984/Mv05994-RA.2